MRCIRAGCGKTTANPTGVCYACESILKIDAELQSATQPGRLHKEKSALSVEREQLNKNKEVGMADRKNKACPECNMVQPSNRQEICDCGHEFKKKAGKTLKGYRKTCSKDLCEKYAVKDGLCCKHYKAEHGVSPYGKAKGRIGKRKNKKQGGQVASRRAHTPEIAGSSPAPATIKIKGNVLGTLIMKRSDLEQEMAALDSAIETIRKYAVEGVI